MRFPFLFSAKPNTQKIQIEKEISELQDLWRKSYSAEEKRLQKIVEALTYNQEIEVKSGFYISQKGTVYEIHPNRSRYIILNLYTGGKQVEVKIDELFPNPEFQTLTQAIVKKIDELINALNNIVD